jgi:hypothetical protein
MLAGSLRVLVTCQECQAFLLADPSAVQLKRGQQSSIANLAAFRFWRGEHIPLSRLQIWTYEGARADQQPTTWNRFKDGLAMSGQLDQHGLWSFGVSEHHVTTAEARAPYQDALCFS